MSKKILSIVLALALAVSCFAVSAFAIGDIGYEEEGSTYTQAWSLSEAAQNDSGVWYVEVSLTANYTVGAMQFKLDLSNPNITIKDVIATKQDGTAGALTADYNADVAFDTTGASNIVAIIPNPVEDASAAIDFTNGGVVCTVYFTVPDGASGTVQIADDAKSATNPGGTLFAARIDDGILSTGTAITGQATTIETEARNIGAVASAELALTDAGSTAGVVIDTNKKFGGTTYAGAVYGFTQAANNTFKNQTYITTNLTATNGGSLSIKSSTNQTTASGNYGTGSTIEVLNADGSSTGKIYVVVIFGDIDGNGLINTTDANAVYTAISGGTIASGSVTRLAANCHNVNNATLLHTINTNDALAVYNQISGTKVASVSLAAKHINHSTNYA